MGDIVITVEETKTQEKQKTTPKLDDESKSANDPETLDHLQGLKSIILQELNAHEEVNNGRSDENKLLNQNNTEEDNTNTLDILFDSYNKILKRELSKFMDEETKSPTRSPTLNPSSDMSTIPSENTNYPTFPHKPEEIQAGQEENSFSTTTTRTSPSLDYSPHSKKKQLMKERYFDSNKSIGYPNQNSFNSRSNSINNKCSFDPKTSQTKFVEQKRKSNLDSRNYSKKTYSRSYQKTRTYKRDRRILGKIREPGNRTRLISESIAKTRNATNSFNRGVVKKQIEALKSLEKLRFRDYGSIRRIKVRARSPKEMGDLLLELLPDFTYQSYVRDGNLSLVKFKEKNWKPIQDFLKYKRIKETRHKITGEIKWRTTLNQHATKKWSYTGKQTLIVEIDLPKMRTYLSVLENQARSFAKDSENTRIYLSKIKNHPDPAVASTYNDVTDFWLKYGYKPSISPTLPRYVNEQYRWRVEHRALSAEQILRQVLASPKINNKRVLDEIDHQFHSMSNKNTFKNIQLKQNSHEVLLGDIIPPDKLRGLDSLDEHLGATKVYTKVMNYHRDFLSNMNPLTEYLQMPTSKIDESDIDDTWGVRGKDKSVGVDKHNNKFRYTFAPDIIVRNLQTNYIEGVINLKGKTQNQTYLSSTGISFQITELMKYTGEHEIPTAMVVIRQSDDTLFYDWLVIPNQTTPFIKELLNPNGSTNPIIPR
ncbi:MAG: hypothetical protein ACTSPV_07255, partial [Candidatus Hodarchaeales archaeon]